MSSRGTSRPWGKNVTRLRPGDRVTVEPCESCGTCDACRRGEYGSCDALTFIYRRGDGAMADYITVKAESVFPLPDALSYEAGALIEPLAVAVHAVRRADVRMGETVVVLGAGAIGMLAAALCRHSGASKVIVSDYSAFRLDMAKTLGATCVVNPGAGENLEAVVLRETDGRGADKVLECVGREETFVQAMTLLRKQGLATVVGIFEQPKIATPVMKLVSNEIRIQGSQGYCWDFPTALQMAGKLGLGKLITHRFKLEELQQALTVALDPTQHTVKIILQP